MPHALDATKEAPLPKVCLSAPKKVNEIAAAHAEKKNKTDSEDDGFFLGAIGKKSRK